MNKISSLLFYPCSRIPEFVYDYIDGNLTKVIKMRFEAHIAMCKCCHEYVLLYRSTANVEVFQKLNPPSSEFLDKTLSFLKAEGLLDEDKLP